MRAWFAKVWGKVVAGFKLRLPYQLFVMTTADFDKNFEAEFTHMKRVSDFVAALFRLSLLFMATTYFTVKAPTETGYMGYALGVAAFLSFMVGVVLITRIFRVIILYWAEDMAVLDNRFLKVFLFATSALFSAGAILAGVELATDLAKISLESLSVK